MTNARRIREQLKHPVLDCDGHWLESVAVLTEHLREIAGPALTDQYIEGRKRAQEWYGATDEERLQRRLRRQDWWPLPAHTIDRATAMLPALMKERLQDLGIDFAIIYTTLGLPFSRIGNPELRRALIRAYNVMTADVYAPYGDFFAPAAMLPVHTPDEAVEELDYAVTELGFKVIMIRGALPRPVPAFAADGQPIERVPYYVDSLGLDNAQDYDALWRRCAELRVAVTAHGGARDWADRTSFSNFTFNHIGHFAQANHTFAKAVFLGGVTRRFPNLNFGFLEGGAGWACSLLYDLVGHFKTRGREAMQRNLRPDRLDLSQFQDLIARYGYPRLARKAQEIASNPEQILPPLDVKTLSARETEHADDFEPVGVGSPNELVAEFSRNFYFGCEAGDPTAKWAFDEQGMGTRLKPVFSSDISHWDVPDMAGVLPEAYELLEDGWLTEQQFEEFTFSNAVRLHGGMNPDFFKRTSIEQAAAKHVP
jgi:predicted TIM-barrel fold metal-dependent hydrolase